MLSETRPDLISDYLSFVLPITYLPLPSSKLTKETGHAGKEGVNPSKRGSSLPNYLDQTQSREFVDGRRREKVIWEIITEKYFNTFADLEGKS